jgi:hypothetical protein
VFTPGGGNEGGNFTPRGQISPLGDRGEVKNGPLPSVAGMFRQQKSFNVNIGCCRRLRQGGSGRPESGDVAGSLGQLDVEPVAVTDVAVGGRRTGAAASRPAAARRPEPGGKPHVQHGVVPHLA